MSSMLSVKPLSRDTSVQLRSLERYWRGAGTRRVPRWSPELQKRHNWTKDGGQLKLGEMVLVKDDRLPPNQWLLGRVTQLYPGTDGISRVADVLTMSGTVRRAFNRLCPLPVEDKSSVPGGPIC
ncbi:uncharacterized protein LOC133529500 isoform X2 [Cydia pomonella]|uniref:uncharacterized protein LOC133529500 isoform X2 n=1 Tax=Cydia pomonella TaxID=82600 RepID=UPI002ADE4B0E|nr:uncharacterized protein LOC133529500 isoform X2 [Cydia pomonella]